MINIEAPNFKLSGNAEDPTQLDYSMFGLSKKQTYVKGELLSVKYYRNYDGVEYSDLVVEELRQYNRNAAKLLTSVSCTTKWYLDDDSVGAERSCIEAYSAVDTMNEAASRRENIISEAKVYVMNAVGYANGTKLLASLTHEIRDYITGVTQPLKDSVANSQEPFVTQEIKDATVSILTI